MYVRPETTGALRSLKFKHMDHCSKIIGGMFGFVPEALSAGRIRATRPALFQETGLMLGTARSALALLVKTLHPARVWLPSYLCDVMMVAVARPGVSVCFYPVGGNLRITNETWLGEVESGDIVVFIDYFGFNTWEPLGKKVRESGAVVVEDACQAMLNDVFSNQSHYVIASPRKFVGVPDGGVLIAMPGTPLPAVTLPPPPGEWWLDAFSATLLRGEFDRHGGDRKWFELFRRFDPNGPVNPHAMSELSACLLGRFDYADIIRRRRENYEFLLSELGHIALFPQLPAGMAPLGFPIRITARDRVRKALFAHDIFPPVHWSLDGVVPDTFTDSHRLAHEIMTLPCDQRYDMADMKRLTNCLSNELRS